MAPTFQPSFGRSNSEEQEIIGEEDFIEEYLESDKQWELSSRMDVIVKRDEVLTPGVTEDAPGANKNGTGGGSDMGVVVRGEEIGIVLVVLILWVGAIILFFNRWGKIRMLEPYQPKFCEHHNPNCPMAEVPALNPQNTYAVSTRTFSKFNLASEVGGSGSPHFSKCNYHGVPLGEYGEYGDYRTGGGGGGLSPGMGIGSRPRQNSVFVTSPNSCVNIFGGAETLKNTSRKTKSAVDLSTLIMCGEFMDNVGRNSKNSITNL